MGFLNYFSFHWHILRRNGRKMESSRWGICHIETIDLMRWLYLNRKSQIKSTLIDKCKAPFPTPPPTHTHTHTHTAQRGIKNKVATIFLVSLNSHVWTFSTPNNCLRYSELRLIFCTWEVRSSTEVEGQSHYAPSERAWVPTEYPPRAACLGQQGLSRGEGWQLPWAAQKEESLRGPTLWLTKGPYLKGTVNPSNSWSSCGIVLGRYPWPQLQRV